MNFVQGETEIRKEFSKLDTDNSGYITKGIKCSLIWTSIL